MDSQQVEQQLVVKGRQSWTVTDEGEEVAIYEMWLENSQGERVDGERIQLLHNNIAATGYFVRMKLESEMWPKEFPVCGMVTAIRDDSVEVSGCNVPRDRFLELYEVD